jgi:hypothetical protein
VAAPARAWRRSGRLGVDLINAEMNYSTEIYSGHFVASSPGSTNRRPGRPLFFSGLPAIVG